MCTKKVFLSGIFAISSISVFSQITYTTPISTIYQGYGNTIVINGVKNPTFQASNAEVLASENSNTIKLIPKIDAETVKLTVLSQGKVVDTKDFKVKRLPLATAYFIQDGIFLDIPYGFNKNAQNTIINIIPPSELREENQYTADISVSIKRDGKTIFSKQNIALGESLNDILQKTQKNDSIVIIITNVKRKNAKEEPVATYVLNPVIVIPVN